MIILDTNVVSAIMLREPPAAVLAWLDQQPSSSLWTTSITVYEIEYGLRRLAPGRRRNALQAAFQGLLAEDFGGRILAFDAEAAFAAGQISAAAETTGRPIEVRDVQIAGIARVRRAVVCTRNTGHFEATCQVVNPWGGD